MIRSSASRTRTAVRSGVVSMVLYHYDTTLGRACQGAARIIAKLEPVRLLRAKSFRAALLVIAQAIHRLVAAGAFDRCAALAQARAIHLSRAGRERSLRFREESC